MKNEELEKLRNLEKGYSQGLNYIDNTKKDSSLRPQYIARLKELREEISNLTQKEETTTKARGK